MKPKNLIAAILAIFIIGIFQPAWATDERLIELEGVLNTRDLGGLRTEDGRTIRTGQIIRSGEIDNIDAEGMSRLDRLGVGAIVDLRTNTEAAKNPATWPDGAGPTRYHFPVMEQESQEIDDMRAHIKAGTATAEDTEGLFFRAFGSIATEYETEIRDLFDVLLAQPEGEAVLYHCSGGKDRTGVATAIVLSALGVTKEDIKADFMMSNVQKDADRKAVEIAEKVNLTHGTKMTPEAVWPSLGVRESYLDQFYKNIEGNYGTVDNYLEEGLNLTESDLETLRSRYLN